MKSRILTAETVIASLILLASFSPPVSAAIIYVDLDAVGAANGMTWEDAFIDLQPALSAAVAYDEIWVADGTYYPSVEVEGVGDRYFSFQLMNDVAVYGGFVGDETELGARDWTVNVCTLSGDIGAPVDYSDNCLHVFHHPSDFGLVASARLDGFTITGGNGDLPVGTARKGGGMYNMDSAPTVANCIFTGNRVEGGSYARGGGMYNHYCSPTVLNCVFTNNFASVHGGGMYNAGYSAEPASPLISGCLFDGNEAGLGGNGDGAAIYNTGACAPIIVDCVFINNHALYNGGAIANNGEDAGGYMANCIFSDNSAAMYGGVLYNRSSATPTCVNCIFNRNEVTAGTSHGGAIYSYASDPVLTNCVFYDNESGCVGQGIYNFQYSDAIITNCILDGEWILYNSADCDVEVTYCCMEQEGYEAPELHNVYADPMLADPDNDDFHLLAASPCLDAGDNLALPLDFCDMDGDLDFDEVLPWDFEGDERRQDDPDTADSGNGEAPLVDIGVDEFASGVSVPGQIQPARLLALRNHPNPFNPKTTISFVLDADANVELAIYNVEGHLIRGLLNGPRPAGANMIVWDGLDDGGAHVSSGVYFSRLVTGDLVGSNRMVLLK